MKKIALLSTAALFTFAACKKNDNPGPTTGPTAKALFTNATLHESSLDVQVNDTAQSGATSLTFLSSKGYMNVRAGNVKIGFVRTNGQGEIASTNASFTTGSTYSVFAVGNGTTTAPSSIIVVTDDLTAPSSNMAKVRFANLSVEPNFVISAALTAKTGSIGTQKVDSNLTMNKVGSFISVASGKYDITLADPNTLKSVTLNDQTLTSGKIYTIVLTGEDGATGNSALKPTIINNN